MGSRVFGKLLVDMKLPGRSIVTQRAFVTALLVASTLSGSLGCAAIGELFRDPEDTVAPLTRPDSIYEALSDNYVELCAVSQYRPVEGDLGGIPGHAVMYLKGACRDESAPYPRLRPCHYATFYNFKFGYRSGVVKARREGKLHLKFTFFNFYMSVQSLSFIL